MIYKDFKGKRLSQLGMGCMRLPTVGGNDSAIDEEQVARMVDYAFEHGINYFDTAYGYHGGNSETVMGKVLGRLPRDRIYIADKFPGYDLSNMPKAKSIFPEQLKKLGISYFDFYMFHNVNEMNVNQYLDRSYGIYDYLLEQRDAGKISHLGFSAHGNMDTIRKFLDAYGENMEFCQLQLNYVDWEFQDGEKKVEMLEELGIPVWVMEPMRGGKLIDIPEDGKAELEKLRPGVKPAEWAFRFLQSIPEAKVILTGASSMEQLKENIEIFGTERPTDARETETLEKIGKGMTARQTLPCTACRYCVPKCPMDLDIPDLIASYNQLMFTGASDFIAPFYIKSLPEDSRPSACIGCGECEKVCPQNLHIPEAFEDFTERIKGWM
ncbi:MAG: aldo/keto reductase [Candidatus Methanomethylophilaceae archaeon]|nr:aldo/keto reductase [Candidatus Methanomethylophilaceae archaeon]